MTGFFNALMAWGPIGVFVLAIIDSAGIPIPMGVDVLVVTLGTAGLRRAFLVAALAVIGSLIGNLILFSIARKGREAYLRRHLESPRARRFHNWFLEYGLLTVFIPALVPLPLPLKIFVISAGAMGVSRHAFLLTILAARVPRYFGLAYLGATVGEASLNWIAAHLLPLSLGAVALFVALYLLIKYRHRGRPNAALG